MNRGASIAAAFALDLIVGDPQWAPHPVRAMGALIGFGERIARRPSRDGASREALAGGALACAIVASAAAYAAAVIRGVRRAAGHRAASAMEVALAASSLATRDLLHEVNAVLDALARDDLAAARSRLARIVGRDTAALDASEISRALIETLAESTCDGIVAPLCALALGGAPLAFAFKAASTLDSMIGHIEPPYAHFGRFAAKLDDALCFIPARLTACTICVLAPLAGGSSASAWRTLRDDGRKHRSPNAGRPEAAMAGALRVRLGGTNAYAGVVHRGETLGRDFRPPVYADARRARNLVLWVASLSAAGLALVAAVCDGS